jgi:UDP-N-acetylmuramoyl-tripeptide--D-alanyl-D-alanine ligase
VIPLTLGEVARAAGGPLRDGDPGGTVSAVVADSRQVSAGALFVALPGSRTDGARFAPEALAAGAAAVLARRGTVAAGPRVEVDDALTGLAGVAAELRARSGARVVGITGSVGKTTTKDLLAAALATRLRTVANAASFNNELGLPLTLARLEPDTEALVVELGARGPGHIATLARLARPEIGVVLNVGEAHIGVFGSRQAIANAKAELVEALPDHGVALLAADDPLVAAMAARTAARVVGFGLGAGAEVRAEDVELDAAGRARFRLRTPSGSAAVAMPAMGEHLVVDAVAAAAAAWVMGLGPEEIAAGLAGARLSPMRMQVAHRADGITVINDAYNANPTSMAAALKALAAAGRGGGRTVAVLGEMAELGEAALGEHDRVGRLAARLGIDRLVGVGELGEVLVRAARMEGMWPEEATAVADADAAVAAVTAALAPGDVVLVKASRVVALDRVAERLLALTEGLPGGSGGALSAPSADRGSGGRRSGSPQGGSG